jgi:Secretion system C-terminal sorting domain
MKKITSIIAALLFYFTIAAQTSIKTDSILQTSTCAGDDILVTFKTTGSFPFSNTFKAQISNGLGSFKNPIEIGNTKFSIFGQGFILAKLPSTVSISFFYKIRVISTNPADTSVSPSNILVTSLPKQLNQIVKVCQNDSISLSSSILGASSYLWSNGATTQGIIARDTIAYSVTTKTIDGCKSTVSDTIKGSLTCTGILIGIDEYSLNNISSIYPNPGSGNFNITIIQTNSKDILITVMDILGKQVYQLSDKNSASEYRKEIDLSHLAKGVYSIKFNVGTDVKTHRLIIQ